MYGHIELRNLIRYVYKQLVWITCPSPLSVSELLLAKYDREPDKYTIAIKFFISDLLKLFAIQTWAYIYPCPMLG